ncbi:FitA-like ribbon-helix-helix domain-containing protein [Gloeobacter kilaueensis]|uniref:Plasmid stability protein n=1 Tax=Gloeobacter kilaueensis (strain ATCC BAA-2537 / CCAP 1431/1 / ULC 316 / JS1) TaxID=1183438 RepID=U5QI25_GLOK1|nr:plasmid stability protein [Gloeobacter kilaueensis]AGY58528.1 plasmid stability protein [Gloeobacter kilaueensis JS1]
MADILVRDLDPETIERLKQLAQSHNRSLQSELKAILEVAARTQRIHAEVVASIDALRASLKPSNRTAVELLREERDNNEPYR